MDTNSNTIVLIHGLWMTSLSWENWAKRFTEKGYNVIAKSWPGIGEDIDAYRRDPSTTDKIGITEVVEHYENILREIEEPPIIIGHSFGGLITEILLDRGWGASGVAIDPAPAKGIFLLPFSTIKSAWPVLKNPFNDPKSMALTEEQFKYAFGNTMTEEESRAVYERYAVPGPDHVLFQGSIANFNPHSPAAVDFHNDKRAPLLLIAGGDDHVVPAAVTRINYHLFKKSSAVTEFKEFPGRSHFTVGENGWEEVADYALEWAKSHSRMPSMA